VAVSFSVSSFDAATKSEIGARINDLLLSYGLRPTQTHDGIDFGFTNGLNSMQRHGFEGEYRK
jgi:hypothetical protein